MTLEDVAIRTVVEYGKTAGHHEINYVLNQNGFADEDGELGRRVLDMVKTAIVRVKVLYA